jgi:hypothetical protein
MQPGHAKQSHFDRQNEKKIHFQIGHFKRCLKIISMQLGQTALGTKGIKMPKSLEPNTHLCKTFSGQATQEGLYMRIWVL